MSAVFGLGWSFRGVNCEVASFLSALVGFSSPGYEVFAEADAQSLTDSTANREGSPAK